MDLFAPKSNTLDVEIEGRGPHLFRPEDYRSWIEGQVRAAVKVVLEEILEAEIAAHLGAAPGERTEGREGYRNGSYTRGLVSRVGALEITVPRDREGSFRPGVFERYRRMESPLEEALLRAYLEGISTRRVGDIAEALSGEGLSASTVSRLNGRLSEQLQEWRERPLSGAYPYLYLDGISLRVRWGGASERVSVLVAIGVTQEGFREVLACGAGFRESEESWRGLLRRLSERGLQGVRLVISDAGAGLKAAMADFLPRALWQRCSVHVMRNVLDKVPQSKRAEVAAALKTIWPQENAAEARHKAVRVKEQFGRSLPAAIAHAGGGTGRQPCLLRLPSRALEDAPDQQPAGAPDEGDPPPHQGGRPVPQRGKCPAAGERPAEADPRDLGRTPLPRHGPAPRGGARRRGSGGRLS